MSIKLMSAVFENGPANSSERFVLLALANYADVNGKCWPAYATLAHNTGLSRPTVMRCVKSLTKQGYLKTVGRRRVTGEQASNYYWISFEKLGVTCSQQGLEDEGAVISGSLTMIPGGITTTLPGYHHDTGGYHSETGGGITMIPPGITVIPDPSINRNSDPSVNRQQKQQQQPARANAIAAAAAPVDTPAMAVLQEYGIALNKTTAPIATMDADFVEGHLLAAQRRGESAGLAIRRIIDGDSVPRKPGDATRQSIPAELADIIKR